MHGVCLEIQSPEGSVAFLDVDGRYCSGCATAFLLLAILSALRFSWKARTQGPHVCSLASVIDGYSDCKHALCDLFLHCLHLTVLFPSFGDGWWQTTHM